MFLHVSARNWSSGDIGQRGQRGDKGDRGFDGVRGPPGDSLSPLAIK